VTEEQLTLIKNDPCLQILPSNQVTEEDGDDEEDENKTVEVKLERATKPQLIEILTSELKQKPGEDFNPEASNAVLKQLVIDLRSKDDGDDEEDEDDEENSSEDDGSNE
jgi:hypothetical protein